MVSLRFLAIAGTALLLSLVGAGAVLAHDIDPPKGRAFHGKITAIAAGPSVVWTVDMDVGVDPAPHDHTILVNVSTLTGQRPVRWPGRPNAAIADFKVGDEVRVHLKRPLKASPYEARRVHFVPRDLERFRGEVTAITFPTSLAVDLQNDGVKTFTLTANTTVKVKGEKARAILAGDIEVGDRVQVVTRDESDPKTALIVRVRGNS